MGEIKSTLDLVMERTRHLSLSTEEKEKQRREDFEKRLQGLLQQYADGALTVGGLRDKMHTLQTEMKIEDRQFMARAVLGRLDPDGDNAHWLALLENLAPEACAPLGDIFEYHRRQQANLLQKGQEALGRELSERDGIGGSAVVPNPLKNTTCQQGLADLRQATLDQINAISEKHQSVTK
jgi:hypothetical protein